MTPYAVFLEKKSQLGGDSGFAPLWMPDFLFDFQQALVEWALRKGRAAIFADCGLGKTVIELVWAENIIRKTNKPVLILTPLAVSPQTVREGEKFGIACRQSRDGTISPGITVTNYEKLHLFDCHEFAGVVCDESSILKNFEGATKDAVTEFLRTIPYRLLCTATASPNDYIELGTSSEALGGLGYMDMLGMFFKNDQNSLHPATRSLSHSLNMSGKWRFKAHAERPFWRWVCSWARALRKPSDLGFDDTRFVLPELRVKQTVVKASRPMNGYLFSVPAVGLDEQRKERRHTIQERCEEAARKLSSVQAGVAWCHLNDEGDLLEKMIAGAVQVSGRDSDEEKEEKLTAFTDGQCRVLVTKPVLTGFGLNWQHCGAMTFFPSHSFEQYYQAVRRCWRFGRTEPVTVDLITTEGESNVMDNQQRKADACEKMFAMLVQEMASELHIQRSTYSGTALEVPTWL